MNNDQLKDQVEVLSNRQSRLERKVIVQGITASTLLGFAVGLSVMALHNQRSLARSNIQLANNQQVLAGALIGLKNNP